MGLLGRRGLNKKEVEVIKGVIELKSQNTALQEEVERLRQEKADIIKQFAAGQRNDPKNVIVDRYNNLIMAVQRKFHGENRYQTVLRYIRERENSNNNQIPKINKENCSCRK